MKEVTKWLLTYFPVAWTAHICQGLAMGILGPSQPYLAYMVGVTNKEINLVWTAMTGGSCLATLAVGAVFNTRITHQRQKLLFQSSFVGICGVFVALVAQMSHFWTLLLVIGVAGFFLGGLDTASNSLVIYMLGPERSPPWTQSLHAMVGVGFLLGSCVIRPFLPEDGGNSEVCTDLVTHNTSLARDTSITSPGMEHSGQQGQANLVYPFSIAAGCHLLSATVFIILALTGVKMPVYEAEKDKTVQEKKEKKENKQSLSPVQVTLLYTLGFIFFAASTMVEGFFSSQIFTIGHCGPHALPPRKSNLLHTAHFFSFFVGRFSGILASNRIPPFIMILISLTGCVFSTFLLAIAGAKVIPLLFLGTGAVGFFVSIQFASGISWLAEHVDLTGQGASVVFLGAYFGWATSPALSGQMSSSLGLMEGFWAVFGLCLLHLAVFLVMLWVSRTRVKEVNVKEVKEMATYLQEDGSGQDEEKKEKMAS